MKTLTAATVALLLAGCASVPRPQLHVVPHKAPIVKAAPVAKPAPMAAPAKPTFSDRFKKFRGHLRWTH